MLPRCDRFKDTRLGRREESGRSSVMEMLPQAMYMHTRAFKGFVFFYEINVFFYFNNGGVYFVLGKISKWAKQCLRIEILWFSFHFTAIGQC